MKSKPKNASKQLTGKRERNFSKNPPNC